MIDKFKMTDEMETIESLSEELLIAKRKLELASNPYNMRVVKSEILKIERKLAERLNTE